MGGLYLRVKVDHVTGIHIITVPSLPARSCINHPRWLSVVQTIDQKTSMACTAEHGVTEHALVGAGDFLLLLLEKSPQEQVSFEVPPFVASVFLSTKSQQTVNGGPSH